MMLIPLGKIFYFRYCVFHSSTSYLFFFYSFYSFAEISYLFIYYQCIFISLKIIITIVALKSVLLLTTCWSSLVLSPLMLWVWHFSVSLKFENFGFVSWALWISNSNDSGLSYILGKTIDLFVFSRQASWQKANCKFFLFFDSWHLKLISVFFALLCLQSYPCTASTLLMMMIISWKLWL